MDTKERSSVFSNEILGKVRDLSVLRGWKWKKLFSFLQFLFTDTEVKGIE
jgi:hypothetical protein